MGRGERRCSSQPDRVLARAPGVIVCNGRRSELSMSRFSNAPASEQTRRHSSAPLNVRVPIVKDVKDVRIAQRWYLAHSGQLSEIVLEDLRVCAASGVFALHLLAAPELNAGWGGKQ